MENLKTNLSDDVKVTISLMDKNEELDIENVEIADIVINKDVKIWVHRC